MLDRLYKKISKITILALLIFGFFVAASINSSNLVLADDGSDESLSQGSIDWGSSQSDGSDEALGQGPLNSQSDGSDEALEQGPLTPLVPTPTPSCPFVFKYSECTWTGPGIVHEVFQDCNGVFRAGNPIFQAGVCGDTSTAPQPTPVPSCPFERKYSECTWTGPGIVHEVFQDCRGNYRAGNPIFQAGVCGDTSTRPQPTPTPRVIFLTPTPIPPVFVPTPTPTPFIQVAQGAAVTADLRCPNGTIFGGISNSNIICIQQTQNQNQVVNNNAVASTGSININLAGNRVVAPTPGKTIVMADTELPKTGVPLFAWAFPGLLPLGLRLRKFGSFKGISGNFSSYLWQKREFDK